MRWLYVPVILAFIYPIFVSVEGWPTGPVPIVVWVWCVWHVASVLIRGKISPKSDWTLTIGGANAGVVFLVFFLLGYKGSTVAPPEVLFFAQVMGIAGTFALARIFAWRFGAGVWSKQLKMAGTYEGSLVKYVFGITFILSLMLGLVAVGFLDDPPDGRPVSNRHVATIAHNSGFLIWSNAIAGGVFGCLVLKSIFLLIKARKEKALKKKEWDAYVRQSRLDRTGENGNPDRPD